MGEIGGKPVRAVAELHCHASLTRASRVVLYRARAKISTCLDLYLMLE
jgi:hypothetical protein